jgi:AcrR family transcriptional regulator
LTAKKTVSAAVARQPKKNRVSGMRSGRKTSTKVRARRDPPTHGRALVTYEKILSSAGQLLGEHGFEPLTTNAICASAGVAPTALYNYFNDKYEILEALAHRLLKRQNDAFYVWLFKGGAWANLDGRWAALEEWYRIAGQITGSEPGAIWTMRALRALPSLAHIRLESQRMLTNQMFEFYRRVLPDVEPKLLWYRLRIACEFGFMVDELALEEERIPHDLLFREAARIFGGPVVRNA